MIRAGFEPYFEPKKNGGCLVLLRGNGLIAVRMDRVMVQMKALKRGAPERECKG
jgi:hypothetical protein